MKFFSDVAFKLLLDPKEIDEERQVIMNEKRTRLSGRQRVQEHALPLHLMPQRFTLTQLQRVCEVILANGSERRVRLDKGAFRRRFAKSLDIAEAPGEFENGAQRPAQLYRVASGFRFL